MSQAATACTSVPRRGRRSTTAVVIGSLGLLAVLTAPAAQAQPREMRSPDVILATGAAQQPGGHSEPRERRSPDVILATGVAQQPGAQSARREERSPDVILATGTDHQPRTRSTPRERRAPDVILAGRDTGPAPLPSLTGQSSGGLDWGYVAIGALGLIGLLGAGATTRHRRGRQRSSRPIGG